MLRDYVSSNKAILLQIQAHGKPVLCASLVNSQVFIETSIVVGIVLAVREVSEVYFFANLIPNVQCRVCG